MDTAIKDRKSKRKRKPTCKSAVVVDDKLERGDTPKKTKPRRKARQADPTIFCASQKGVLALTFATDNPSVEAIGASKTIIRLTCPSLPSSLRPQTVSHQAVPDFISLSNPPTPVSAPRPTRAAKPISYKFDPFEGVEYIADDRCKSFVEHIMCSKVQ